MFRSPGPDQALYHLFHPQGRLGRSLPDGCSPARYAQWMQRMATGDSEIAHDLHEHLHPWGWRLIFHLTCTGLTFKRYDKEEFDRRMGTWNERSGKPGKVAVYDEERNVVAVDANYWSASVSHHEMAHALDRLLSYRSGLFSGSLWHGFAPKRVAFFCDYAASHPSEYFAVSLERFLCDDTDALWLSRNDSGMHAFLTALFELSGMEVG